MNHEIQLQGLGARENMDHAPGGPASLSMSHTSATVTQAATSDLEDPPGLYEKASAYIQCFLAVFGCFFVFFVIT